MTKWFVTVDKYSSYIDDPETMLAGKQTVGIAVMGFLKRMLKNWPMQPIALNSWRRRCGKLLNVRSIV
jgi:hypothetical protein